MARRLPDFERLGVGVLGDGIVDEYVIAAPTRLSREAPVPILRHQRDERRPGGAANVATNLAALGARPALFGVVGDDAAGRALRSDLRARGVDVEGLVEVPGWTTPTKQRVLAGESHRTPQQVLRLDREPDGPPPAEALAQVGQALAERAASLDGLILSDYGYGGLGAESLQAADALAARGLPVVVDPRRRPDLIAGPLALTPNLDELASFAGREAAELSAPEALADAARALLRRTGARWLLATLGNRGMALFGSAGETARVPVSGPEDVVDVSGAGDTAVAVFTLGLTAGQRAQDAMALANAASGLVVMERGAVAPRPERLQAAWEDAPQPVEGHPRDGARSARETRG